MNTLTTAYILGSLDRLPGLDLPSTRDNMDGKIRFEGLTLTVDSVARSIEFYSGKLGLTVEWNALPAFAMIRIGARAP